MIYYGICSIEPGRVEVVYAAGGTVCCQARATDRSFVAGRPAGDPALRQMRRVPRPESRNRNGVVMDHESRESYERRTGLQPISKW